MTDPLDDLLAAITSAETDTKLMHDRGWCDASGWMCSYCENEETA